MCIGYTEPHANIRQSSFILLETRSAFFFSVKKITKKIQALAWV